MGTDVDADVDANADANADADAKADADAPPAAVGKEEGTDSTLELVGGGRKGEVEEHPVSHQQDETAAAPASNPANGER